MLVTSGETLLLASSEQRSGILLNITQCAGQSPMSMTYLTQNVRSAAIRKLWTGITKTKCYFI